MSAVWAIFLSQILNQNDVIFGRLINGRNAAIPGIEEVVGSYINIVPVRVDVKSHHTLMELILAVQEQLSALAKQTRWVSTTSSRTAPTGLPALKSTLVHSIRTSTKILHLKSRVSPAGFGGSRIAADYPTSYT